jgi:hypothetical protein
MAHYIFPTKLLAPNSSVTPRTLSPHIATGFPMAAEAITPLPRRSGQVRVSSNGTASMSLFSIGRVWLVRRHIVKMETLGYHLAIRLIVDGHMYS